MEVATWEKTVVISTERSQVDRWSWVFGGLQLTILKSSEIPRFSRCECLCTRWKVKINIEIQKIWQNIRNSQKLSPKQGKPSATYCLFEFNADSSEYVWNVSIQNIAVARIFNGKKVTLRTFLSLNSKTQFLISSFITFCF